MSARNEYSMKDVEMLLGKLIEFEDMEDTKTVLRARKHILWLLEKIGLPEPFEPEIKISRNINGNSH